MRRYSRLLSWSTSFLFAWSCGPDGSTAANGGDAAAAVGAGQDGMDSLDSELAILDAASEDGAPDVDATKLADNGVLAVDSCASCLDAPSEVVDLDLAVVDDVANDGSNSDAGATSGFKQATGDAPIPPLLPWPPTCDNPKSKSQSIEGEPSCWEPPNGSCAGSDAASVFPACSVEGDYCCVFSSSCIPCNWVSCFGCPTGEDCPDVCKLQKWPYADEKNAGVWYSEKCVLLQTILSKCATCGADTFCPWVK